MSGLTELVAQMREAAANDVRVGAVITKWTDALESALAAERGAPGPTMRVSQAEYDALTHAMVTMDDENEDPETVRLLTDILDRCRTEPYTPDPTPEVSRGE